MAPRSTSRAWHLWWSLILAAPMALIGLTAIFIAHGESLGFKKVDVAASWLPGYGIYGMSQEAEEVRAFLDTGQGTYMVGTKEGLLASHETGLTSVAALAGIEVRSLAMAQDTVLAGTKEGLWARQDGNWKKLLGGEVWSVSATASGVYRAAVKDVGMVESRDGGATWGPIVAINEAVAADAAARPEQPLSLHKVVMDLHTGKAFLGKQYEWFWIDLTGFALVLLTFTGIRMWWRTRNQRRDMAATSIP